MKLRENCGELTGVAAQPASHAASPFSAAAVAPAATGRGAYTADAARRCQFQMLMSAHSRETLSSPRTKRLQKCNGSALHGARARTDPVRSAAEVLPALCHEQSTERCSWRCTWRKNRHPETRTRRVPENVFSQEKNHSQRGGYELKPALM